jgi:uncharacterized protein (TIGR03435 family)
MNFRLITSLLASGIIASAQATAPAFDVASIRPGQPFSMELLRSGGVGMKIDASRVIIRSWTLGDIIGAAYRVRIDQIAGPDWLSTPRFEIQATMPEGAKSSEVPEMLQKLLADRFGLVAHKGQKQMPLYSLIVGKPPLRMKESTADDTTATGCSQTPNGHRACHMTMDELVTMLTSLSRMNAAMPPGSMPWGVDRPTVNDTGLKGSYDFPLDYGPQPADNGGGSILDAVERLGLKLDPQKRNYDNIIIDKLEKTYTGN